MKQKRNFKRDAAIGQVAEKLVSLILDGCGFKTTPVSDIANRKLWDLEAEAPRDWYFNQPITIEVKHDVYEAKSGNIAIETWNSKKNEPAGINVTQAVLWAHVLSDSIWVARVSDLRNYVTSIKPLKTIETAGDGNAFIYLYKSKEILEAIFHRIDKKTVGEVKNKLKELCSTKY